MVQVVLGFQLVQFFKFRIAGKRFLDVQNVVLGELPGQQVVQIVIISKVGLPLDLFERIGGDFDRLQHPGVLHSLAGYIDFIEPPWVVPA